MQLTLSTEDQELLVRVVDRALRELRPEVRRTRTPDYHDALKAEEEQLRGLLDRLRGGEG